MKTGSKLYCKISGPEARPLLLSKLRTRVLNSFHGLDHCGQKELKKRAAKEYYWPKQGRDVSHFVKQCHPCQLVKTGRYIKPPTNKITVPNKRFSYLNLDIVGPLPESRGHRYLLTILDRTSRFFQAVPLINADAESCCRAFLNHWVAFFSLPVKACSDNGNTFISHV